MLCHTAVTHLPARHTLPSPLLTLHTCVLAQMTLTRPRLTLWLLSDVIRCFHLKAADFWNLWQTFTHSSDFYLHPSLCPSCFLLCAPTHTLYIHTHTLHTRTHTHTRTILSLLLFSRVWMSNCSGPQRERRIDRKRRRRVYKYTSTVYENHQKLREGGLKMDGMFVLVCCLWVVHLCAYVVDVKRGEDSVCNRGTLGSLICWKCNEEHGWGFEL